MSVILTFSVLLIISTICMYFMPRWSKHMTYLTLLPLYVLFVLLYLYTSDMLAQDRHNYYLWYLSSPDNLTGSFSQDYLFTLILSWFPEYLDPLQFGFILSTVMFWSLAGFILLLQRDNLIALKSVSILMLVIITDRLFLDMTMNATRSSLSGLLFIIGVTSRSFILRSIIWLISFGIHWRIFTIIFVIYLLSLLIKRSMLVLWAMYITGVGFFIAHYQKKTFFLSRLLDISRNPILQDSESIRRGFTITTDLTLSLVIQIFIAIIFPVILMQLQDHWRNSQNHGEQKIEDTKIPNKIMVFGICAASIILIFYPEIALSHRLFMVAIICLNSNLNYRSLKLLSGIKIILFMVFVGRYLV